MTRFEDQINDNMHYENFDWTYIVLGEGSSTQRGAK